jgi:hypothetical protein
MDSFFEPRRERIGVGFDQTHQPVGKHHTHPLAGAL